MPSCLPQLVTALNGKREKMENLLLLLKDEQKSIIEVDLAGLESLESRKRELLGAMERGNAEYRLLLKEAARELNLEKVENLSPLISKSPAPFRETLGRLQSTLLETGESLNRILDFNRELLEGSLNHVRENMAFFDAIMNRRKTYGDSGTMVMNGNKSRLVCKEI
ncbi:flgN protein [Geobacter sp. OR-1]|uniref:flagellar protein FlgN n=1 Tax=Geobacter sp. OR-1 TaxID=1266765 RepID=UPI0005421C17|nr:flagellar protein FlgN [Geobacter sp. OR-1]GAM09670.1 flgN protein [Geobacter sp. OR-1]